MSDEDVRDNNSSSSEARDGEEDRIAAYLETVSRSKRVNRVNEHDEDELSPLHYAARYNNVRVVKVLIKYGADPNDLGEDGLTPLHFSARCKRALRSQQQWEGSEDEDESISAVHYLVGHDADINARDQYGLTPLHMACMRGNEIACRDLLHYSSSSGKSRRRRRTEINIEAKDKQGMTALHLAATHNHANIIKLLLSYGVQITVSDEENSTALHCAAAEGNLDVCRMLLDKAEQEMGWSAVSQLLTQGDVANSTPLLIAVEHGHVEIAELCLEKGADVKHSNNDLDSALHLAAVAGNLEICTMLVKKGARVDATNLDQATPLHKAAANNHAEVVQFLLSSGAKKDKHDKDNFSPLVLAASEGHASVVEVLLDNGADVDSRDKDDKSSMFWAAEEDNAEVLKVLLKHEESKLLINEPDRYFNTPLHIGCENGNVHCVRILLENGAVLDAKNEDEETPLHLAAKAGKTNVVRELVSYGNQVRQMVVNDEDENSNTPLHLAALAGHEKVVRVLLDNAAAVDARNCNNWTPLDCAADHGWLKTAQILLQADAPIDSLDKNKISPLHLACMKGHADVVNLLIQWEARVDARTWDQRNCLDLAIDLNRKEAAMAVVKSDKWQLALRNEYRDVNTKMRVTPMRKLIRKMPDVAEEVFDRCASETTEVAPEHPDYEISFNYEYLDDVYQNWTDTDTSDSVSETVIVEPTKRRDGKVSENAKPYSYDSIELKRNHPLMIMVDSKREDLLAHPLVTMLLRHKWNEYGRYVYYANLTLYCFFLAFLTGYIWTSTPPYNYHDKYPNNRAPDDVYKYRTCAQIVNLTTKGDEIFSTFSTATTSVFLKFGKYILLIMCVIFLARELIQFWRGRWNYFGFENLIEWILYVSTTLLVVDFCDGSTRTGLREDWQWQFGAVAIFLGWMDLVLFIRKLPRFGIYVLMFTDVLKTFTRFFMVFLLFIIAFSMSFYVLLGNHWPFRTPGVSLIKTSVMMIGEFEFDDIFFASHASDNKSHSDMVYYQEVTMMIFIFFLILMTIIIMNLLVGLAVDDIKAVQEQAVLKRLAMQVELALDVEGVIPHSIRRRFFLLEERITPNKLSIPRMLRRFLHLAESAQSATSIAKSLNPELDEWERLEENQEKMQRDIRELKSRIKIISRSSNRMESMVEALLEHNNISWEENDETDSITVQLNTAL